ncbi:MAG: hypothetical protein ABJA64_00105 [Candidatus Saccharibacteria bacterium]
MTNSRPHKKQPVVWRRRKCEACGTVFTTVERPSLADNTPVHLPDGTIDSFNLGRLIVSIADSFSHAPVEGKSSALWLAQTVETTIASQLKTITPEDIEAVTHQVLKKYDELAAVQYAAKHQLIVSVRRRGRPSLVSL